MRTIETVLYKFDELSESAQERAYLVSEEVIKECIHANDYEFTEDGVLA